MPQRAIQNYAGRKAGIMPEKETLERARQDVREGKSHSTQAREFVREEIHPVREGKHGAASPQQAIAIGLSKARRGRSKAAGAAQRQNLQQDQKKGRARSQEGPGAFAPGAIDDPLQSYFHSL